MKTCSGKSDIGGSDRRRRGSTARRLGLAVVLAVILTGAGTPPAGSAAAPQDPSVAVNQPPSPPIVRSVEVGGGWADYSGDLGTADGEFVKLTFAQPWRYTWVFDLGRESRFGETSYGGGVTYTRFLPGDTNFSIGLSSGTGDFLAPRYRLGAAFSGSIAGTVTTLGYLRNVSKGENRSDGISLGLLRYVGHWILGSSVRHDIGQPGTTHSTSWGAGITWYTYRQTYIGVSADFGDVSYVLVGPSRALVSFDSRGYSLGISQWLNSNAGLNLRLSYGDTSFYEVRGATLSLFREW
jgi:YaiO family outer membrane protein